MKTTEECLYIDDGPYVRSERPSVNLLQTKTNEVDDEQLICMSCATPVVLSKLFGPLIFADIRIRADAETCQWVIERQNIKTNEWTECARIEGQIDGEFEEE